MATLSPTIITAVNSLQELFTIATVNDTNGTAGVPEYNTVGNTAVVTYSTLVVNNDVDASVDVNGDIGLNTGLVFTITCQADATNCRPARLALLERDTGIQVGDSRAVGETLQVTINSQAATYYNVVVYSADGSNFAYPDRINTVSVAVQAIAGYTV
jgi:hypothetical protein